MKKHITNNKLIILISLLIIISSFFIKNNTFKFITLFIYSIFLIIFFIKKFYNKTYFLEIKTEIKNIVWPNKKEINQSMLIIISIIILASIILWMIDSILTFTISKII